MAAFNPKDNDHMIGQWYEKDRKSYQLTGIKYDVDDWYWVMENFEWEPQLLSCVCIIEAYGFNRIHEREADSERLDASNHRANIDDNFLGGWAATTDCFRNSIEDAVRNFQAEQEEEKHFEVSSVFLDEDDEICGYNFNGIGDYEEWDCQAAQMLVASKTTEYECMFYDEDTGWYYVCEDMSSANLKDATHVCYRDLDPSGYGQSYLIEGHIRDSGEYENLWMDSTFDRQRTVDFADADSMHKLRLDIINTCFNELIRKTAEAENQKEIDFDDMCRRVVNVIEDVSTDYSFHHFSPYQNFHQLVYVVELLLNNDGYIGLSGFQTTKGTNVDITKDMRGFVQQYAPDFLAEHYD